MIKTICAFFCIVVLAGCASPGSFVDPQTGVFQDENVRFSVPIGWKVTMRNEVKDRTFAFVEAPGNAVFIVQGFPSSEALGPEGYAKKLSRDAAIRTPVASVLPGKFEVKKGDPAVVEKFSVTVMKSTVPHTRRYYERKAGDSTYYLTTQVADEDAKGVELGYRQLLATFRANP